MHADVYGGHNSWMVYHVIEIKSSEKIACTLCTSILYMILSSGQLIKLCQFLHEAYIIFIIHTYSHVERCLSGNGVMQYDNISWALLMTVLSQVLACYMKEDFLN